MKQDTRPVFAPCERLAFKANGRWQDDILQEPCAQDVAFFQADSIFGFKPYKCIFSGYQDDDQRCLRIVVYGKDGDVYGDLYCLSSVKGTLFVDLLDKPRKCFERDIFAIIGRLWLKIRRLPDWLGFSTDIEVDLNGGLKLELTPIA